MFRMHAATGGLVAVSVSAALILTGCGVVAPPKASAPSAVPIADSSAWPIVTLSGKGRLEHRVDVPAEAKSMLVTFACTSGAFDLTSNSDMFRIGSCGGLRSFHLPLPEHSSLNLVVGVEDDSTFSLTAEFRTDVATPDPVIAAECTTLSDIDSAILNAEEGFAHGDVPTAEWTSIVDRAARDLEKLTSGSAGLIGQQLPAVLAHVTESAAAPGELLKHPNDSDAARDIIRQVCSGNGTPLILSANYGG